MVTKDTMPGKALKTRSLLKRQAGISLIEILIALTILAIALMGMIVVILQSSRMTALQQENMTAMRAAQNMIEQMENTPFNQILDTFSVANGNPDFAVAGLETQAGDPDGLAGRIIFPENAGDLDETIADTGWNMPMDLNGDGDDTDTAVTAGEYVILPVRVQIDWTGRSGDRSITYDAFLIDRTN